MFRENRHGSNLAVLFLGAALSMSPCALFAQHGTGGMGGSLAGGGGLSGSGGIASGLDTKDDLKGFHDVLALQASRPQISQFKLMLKSTEAASSELQAFQEQAAKENKTDLGEREKTISAAIEQVRTENATFLEQLSDRQKSGLRETIKKLNKTDSELAQQVKALNSEIAERKTENPITTSADNLKTSLANFHDLQLALGDEMSISPGANNIEAAYTITPVKTTVNFENQPIAIITSGSVSKVALPGVQNAFRVQLAADLSDLQQNLTEVLRTQINRSDQCGEQITIQTAALTPSAPTSSVLAQLHYERWACFGGRGNANEMAEGNGSMEVTLTPMIAEDGTLRISPVVSRIDAEGLVGDLLRSGTLGETVRDKIAESVLSAVRQGSDYKAILPPAAQGYVKLQRAQFQGMGAGELSIVLDGSMQVPDDKVAATIEAQLVGAKPAAAAQDAPAAQAPR
jgi:hypothetical protein